MNKFNIRISLFILLLLFILLFPAVIAAQSPYYSFNFQIDDPGISKYNISLVTCKINYTPRIPSGDYWFGKDTSTLDFQNLPDSLIEKISCNETAHSGTDFDESNQAMVWENFYEINIIHNSSDTMRIVFPVRIKNFVTHISLGKIPFIKGFYDITDNIIYSFTDFMYLKLPENFNWNLAASQKSNYKFIK